MRLDNIILPLAPGEARKWVSRIYWTIAQSVLLFLCLLLVLALDWFGRHPVAVGLFGGVAPSLLGVGKGVATRACRRMGISQESEHRETIRRDPHAVPAPLPGEAPTLSLGKPDKPRTRISAEGVERKNWRGRPLFVPWRDVEWCTYDTNRDATGRASRRLALWDGEKKRLLWLCLNEQQAASVLAAIRFYLRGESLDSVASTST